MKKVKRPHKRAFDIRLLHPMPGGMSLSAEQLRRIDFLVF